MERILLKISGACLKKESDSIIDTNKLLNIAKQIEKIASKYSIGIVIGGGNIWRGNFNKEMNLDKNLADNMGMISTLINCLALENALRNLNLNAKTFCAFDNEISSKFNHQEVNEFLNKPKSICLFAGGTGNSYFSTDTAASLRACQINAKTIYMGKNGVDGVYSDDPNKNSNAKFYKSLKFQEVIDKKLKVMDITALTMCDENNIEIIVFNIDDEDSLTKIVTKKGINFTTINK